MSKQASWTRGAVRTELTHLICCSSDGKPCNLRFPERANVPGRSTNTDWAAFQLAAHARADVITAMAELWPETVALDWEHLTTNEVRALPAPVQALWVVIVRGPGGRYDERPALPEHQHAASQFGFLPWRKAFHILGRRRDIPAFREEMNAALDLIVAWLNPPWEILPAERSTNWMGVHCSPERHEFSVSGNAPAIGMRCLCGRMAYRP